MDIGNYSIYFSIYSITYERTINNFNICQMKSYINIYIRFKDPWTWAARWGLTEGAGVVGQERAMWEKLGPL